MTPTSRILVTGSGMARACGRAHKPSSAVRLSASPKPLDKTDSYEMAIESWTRCIISGDLSRDHRKAASGPTNADHASMPVRDEIARIRSTLWDTIAKR